MKTLYEYIINNLKVDLNDIEINYLKNGDQNGLNHILFNCFIENNSKICVLPQSKTKWPFIASSHDELIDECIFHLIQCNYTNNVLTFGYKLANDSNVVSKLFCYSTNTNVTFIRGKQWRILHQLVGTLNFMHILINTSLFYYNGKYFRQIIGNLANSPQTAAPWTSQDFSKTRGNIRSIDWRIMLYRHKNSQGFHKILPESPHRLWEEIFGMTYRNEKYNTLKRTVHISHFIFSSIHAAHKKINYRRIISTLAHDKSSFETPIKAVIRLIIVLIRKTFSGQLLGPNRNYAILSKNISLLSRKPLNVRVPFQKLFEGVKVKPVKWLPFSETSMKSKLHVKEYELKKKIYQDFYFWLLDKYIPRLISSIFYVTEISSTQQLIFIIHEKWNKKTNPFLKQYIDNCLVENTNCDEHRSFKHSAFNHRSLRMVPKRGLNDFRVITAPSKGLDESEHSEYNNYVKNVLAPTKIILERIRMNRKTSFEKISSTFQIAPLISRFKSDLIKHNGGSLPILHFIKFDIASCFDSIPIAKVLNMVHSELEKESQFFIRTHEIIDCIGAQSRKKHVVNGDGEFKSNDLVIDMAKSFKLTAEDVKKVLEMEFYKTALRLRDKCFLRKTGVNQGAPLSSIIVDILYDDLLEFYDVFKPKKDEKCLILKLADDFMIISDCLTRIIKIRNLAVQGFTEYNATINKQKLECISSNDGVNPEISFCALQINIKTLELWKEESTYNILSSYFGSSKRLFSKLLWLLDMRLSYNLFDEKLNSWKVMLKHLNNAIINLAKTFIVLFAGKIFTSEEFTEFLTNVLKKLHVALKFVLANSLERFLDIRRETLAGFYLVLKPRKSDFPVAVNVLKRLELELRAV